MPTKSRPNLKNSRRKGTTDARCRDIYDKRASWRSKL
jgi:hypothetical protein